MRYFAPRASLRVVSALIGAALLAASVAPTRAAPALVVDVASGAVLYQEEATRPWYPASLTKLMTVYVALKAVHERRLTMQTPLLVSSRAARMVPSKMGFKPGAEVTLENALKMIMVKSANDVSVTIAEGISGSVENFAAEMTAVARALGMRNTNFVNPHGLHDAANVSTARDMAILARALLIHFPNQRALYGIGALQLDSKIIRTHNGLLGRYPGADGMKTGFICAAGFNVVATATRGGRQLVAVVMGSPNAKARTLKTMAMFEHAFARGGSGGQALTSLAASRHTTPPNMRSTICGPKRNRNATEDLSHLIAGLHAGPSTGDDSAASFFAADRGLASSPALQAIISGDLGPRPTFDPVSVFVGRAPGYAGATLAPRGEEPAPEAAPAPAAATPAAAPLPPPRPAGLAAARATPKKPAAAARSAARSSATPAAKPAAKPASRSASRPAPRAAQAPVPPRR